MTDHVVLDAGSGGDTIAAFEDTNSVKWPAGVGVYITSEANPDVIYVPIAAALADNMTNPTTLLQGACLMVYDGSTWDRLLGDSTNGALVNLGTNNDVTVTGTVDLGSTDSTALDAIATAVTGTLTVASHAVTNAGTFAVQVSAALPTGTNSIGKLAANDGVDIGDVTLNNTSIAVTSASALDVSAATVTVDGTGTFATQSVATGNAAHDAADSGNPVKVGGKAVTSEPTAVATADRTDFIADVHGRQIITPYCNKEQVVSGTATATDTSNTAVLAAAGAGVKNYVTSLAIYNASSTDTYVIIKDGTTSLQVYPAPANGGSIINLTVPLASTANTAINFASGTSVTTMYVSAVGFTGA